MKAAPKNNWVLTINLGIILIKIVSLKIILA
jgi:hypothetical protein